MRPNLHSAFLILLCIQIVFTLIPPGQDNPYYLIESYYGSRSKEFNTSEAILNDKPVTFQWCTNFDYDSSKGRVYFADRTKHTIRYRDLSTDETILVAGIDSYAGYRDGDLTNTLFNSPTALKIFRYDKVKAQQARNAITIILETNPPEECLYATYYNYSGCQNTSAVGAVLADPSLALTLYPDFDSDDVTATDDELEELSGKILFVMDRENSCIRKLDLDRGVSETFAGQCGTSGFMDGPLYVNLFNKPDSFGIDDLGNLFVLDAGNQYIRVVSQTGYVRTLIKGACNEATKQGAHIVDNLQTRFVTCYSEWNKTSGLPDSHIFTDLTDLEKCFTNDVLCGGKNRSHPVLYKNSTFRGSFNDESRILKGNDL